MGDGEYSLMERFLQILIYHGNAKKGMKPKEIMNHDIVITTYGIISNEWVGSYLNPSGSFYSDADLAMSQSTTKTRIALEKITGRSSTVASIESS